MGDSTLDGIVNIDDLGQLAQNYSQTPRNWQQGDYNYDGIVNIDDLGILAQNYSQALPDGGFIPPAGADSQFAADYAKVFGASAPVPEPGTLGLLGAAAIGLLSHRRRIAKSK